MNFSISKMLLGALFLAVFLISACGGGGSTAAAGGGGGGVSTVLMGGAMQGIPLNLTQAVSTFAGAAQGADGTGASANFNNPYNSVSDGTNLYVADAANHTIRQIVIASGVVTTLAGKAGVAGAVDGTGTAARFNYPTGITLVGGNLYVSEPGNHIIRQIVIASGVVTTMAGTAGSTGPLDGTGTAARFNLPYDITADSLNLYVLDTGNQTIRQIVISSGVVTTLAGTAGLSGSADGTGTAARFNLPYGITTDGSSLYVADYGNYTIRQIAPASGALSAMTSANAVVTTLAGTAGTPGSADGTGTAATFNWPTGITTDNTNLYVVDYGSHIIRQIVIASGVVTTLAGTAGTPGSADGTGTAATFNNPNGITANGGHLFVADCGNSIIRQIVISSGVVTTLAGTANLTGTVDATGTAARFESPSGITTDGINLYVTNKTIHTIRKIVISSGVVTTLAGTAGSAGSVDDIGTAATFNNPDGITTDGSNLYVADAANHTIRKIVIASGVVTTLAGMSGTQGSADGTGTAASFNWPAGITTDGRNLYVTDQSNHTIRKIVIASGVVTTLAGTVGTTGAVDATGTAATFFNPSGITTDGLNLYVADQSNQTIRKIVISSGVVTTLAGTVGTTGAVDATGTAATFNLPTGITTDGSNLYVTEYSNHTIRQIVISSGVVTTLAGTAGTTGSADATGTAATFSNPFGITSDGSYLYVADLTNKTVRKLQ